jgi:hypothetical protein
VDGRRAEQQRHAVDRGEPRQCIGCPGAHGANVSYLGVRGSSQRALLYEVWEVSW